MDNKKRKKVALIFEIREDIDSIVSCSSICLYTKSGQKIYPLDDVLLREIPEEKSTFRPKQWWRNEDYYSNGYNDCLRDLMRSDV